MQPPLNCAVLVFRAMARKQWIDPQTKSVLPAAFVRRPPPQDGDGLSVDIQSAASCASALNKCHGVASLHVGRTRDLELDIVIDKAPHANITGVPRPEEDQANAERLASQLARQARVVPPERYKSAP
jgi:hypothetical protein